MAARSAQFTGKPVSQVLIEVGEDLLSDGDARSAISCFEEAMQGDEHSWYATAELGRCYAYLKRPQECLTYYRTATERAERSSAFGSIRNGINEAKQQLYGSLSRQQLVAYQKAMLENSQKAYDDWPSSSKNSQDLSEDQLTTGQFAEAIHHATETASLVAQNLRVGRAHDREGTRRWAKGHVRAIRSRQKWVLAKSYVGLSDLERAGKLVWRAASLAEENADRSWYEAVTIADEKLKTPSFVIRAYQRYLDRLRDLGSNGRRQALLHQLPKLIRRARNNFELIGDSYGHALTSKYFQLLILLEPTPKFTKGDKVQQNWRSGSRLMKSGQYQFSLELLLNYLRLGVEPFFASGGLSRFALVADRLGHKSLARRLAAGAQVRD